MRTIISNKIYIYNPSEDVKSWVKNNLYVTNPDYQQLVKLGKEDVIARRHVPQKIALFIETNSKDLAIPSGCLRGIWDLIKNDPYELKFSETYNIAPNRLNCGDIQLKLYDYQQKAVDFMISRKGGILEAPCGSGKTEMAVAITKILGQRTLFLCHTGDLLNQAKERFKKYLPYLKVGTITEGKVQLGEDVTFATWQTMCKVDRSIYQDYFNVVMVDECFSGDTEILTENGFIRFDELKENVKVAQYENGNVSFVNPIRYINKKAKEYVSFKYKDVEIKVTANHNMVSINQRNKECIIPAIEYIRNKNNNQRFITSVSINDDENQILKPIDRIKIMLQADGCFYGRKESESEYQTYKLEFSRQRKIDRFKKLCKDANIPYKEHKIRKFKNEKWNDVHKFTIRMPKNENKYKILTDFLEQPRNSKYANDIIDEIKQWDGHIRNDKGEIEYDSAIRENVDFIKTCSFLANIKCSNIIETKRKNSKCKNIYRIYIGKQMKIGYSRFKKTLVNETLDVYCVEVPTHKIVVRKDGFIFVCGNCHHATTSPTQIKHLGQIVDTCKARYKYGITATPSRSDTMINGMYALLGVTSNGEFSATYEIQKSETPTLTSQHIKYDLDTPFDYMTLNSDGSMNYAYLIDFLSSNEYRNTKILENVVECQKKGRKQLILCNLVKQCDWFQEKLEEIGVKSQELVGSVTSKNRNKVLHNEVEWDVIVATYSLAKEGLDLPMLDTLHLATPQKMESIIVQSAGRIERVRKDKNEPIIYDYVDVNFPYCLGAYKKRKSHLKNR